MTWWMWFAGGLALFALELFTPGGIVFVFFGVGAAVAGLAALLGAGAMTSWLIFPLVSVISLLLFRRPILARIRRGEPAQHPTDGVSGEVGTAMGDLPSSAVGSVELRGTAWAAKNDGTTALAKGDRCRVHRVDGLMLYVRAEEKEI